MRAKETSLLQFLEKSHQFEIPIYQRTYSWDETHCSQLWYDIIRAGKHDSIKAHFAGSVVYIEQDVAQVSDRAPLLVIDGQQRLTSAMLILEAVARRLGSHKSVAGVSAENIRNYYLLDNRQQGDRRYKLLLTKRDRASLISILDEREGMLKVEEHSHRVIGNFDFFNRQIKQVGGEKNLDVLWRGLSKLSIVDVALEREKDNPQLIYESMNSTGLDLSQADLVRNFILMGLEEGQQRRLYKDYWRPMEATFGQQDFNRYFNKYFVDFLTIRTGKRPRENDVYTAFKRYVSSRSFTAKQLVEDIYTTAVHYCAIIFGKERDEELKTAFDDVMELKVSVVNPLLLKLYEEYKGGSLAKHGLLGCVRLIESYLFRRFICSIQTQGLNKITVAIVTALNNGDHFETLVRELAAQPTTQQFPCDDEFVQSLKERDIYSFKHRSYFFRRLENYERKELVPTSKYPNGRYTIEHIMPQRLSDEWRSDLGDDYDDVHKRYLHTLGNLTLTGYNSEYGNRSFKEKRDTKSGFRESPLRLNKELGQLDVWNEAEITKRAERLAKIALEVWQRPWKIPKPPWHKTKISKDRELSDYKFLGAGGQIRPIFVGLRREVMEIHENVSEVYRRHHIAYKVRNRNFVDVQPMASSVRCVLNMKFQDVVDPEGKAKDNTGKLNVGNGDVELKLFSIDDIPYAMRLIRQAFDKRAR